MCLRADLDVSRKGEPVESRRFDAPRRDPSHGACRYVPCAPRDQWQTSSSFCASEDSKSVNSLQDIGDETARDIRLKLVEISLAPSGVHSALDICRFLSGTIN